MIGGLVDVHFEGFGGVEVIVGCLWVFVGVSAAGDRSQ